MAQCSRIVGFGIGDASHLTRVVAFATGITLAACRATAPPLELPRPLASAGPTIEPAAQPTLPASAVPAASVTRAPECPPDLVPMERQRPPGERPFVQLIPDEDVALTRTTPRAPVRFGKVICEASSDVWRDAEGRVRVCTVAQRTTVGGIHIAAGAYTRFHADGRAEQTTIARAQTLRAGNDVPIPCAADFVALSKTGALRHCKLEKPIELSGVACRRGESVSFHADGALSMAVLDRPHTLAGSEFPGGTRLAFHPDGALAGGWLREPLRVLGVLIRWDFSIYPSGKLHTFELAEKQTLQGQELPQRAKVELREDGSLRRAHYVVNSGFMPHGEMWEDTKYVSFDCHGQIVSQHTDHWQADRPPPSLRSK